ncbi:phage tail tape measure protein [Mixta theicola]|uniref:Phage tail tape measure protein n=1 Tax=Mixta theicola TaxID=1458355 RepID=A0A2K1QCQ0_9GAMM|nr:phage tail tape measure protein [Mixta theicola]PNS12809.1 phage tail tape measure protein [Mixta theicola]GLR09061.1 phage tail tape measure protein [Mixta theicola]
MSNNLKLQVLLKAVDQATRPFKAIQTATKSLSGSIRETQSNIKALDQQAAKIDGFRKASTQLAVTRNSLKEAKEEASALAVAFRNTERPTAAQTRALEAAKRAAAELQTKENSLRLSVQQQREALIAAGISTKNLSSEQQRLKTNSAQATVSLSRQKTELQRLGQQQEKLNRVNERYRAGQEIAGKVRNTGAAAFAGGSAALYAEGQLIAPGVEFDAQMSETQALLDTGKDDPKLAAIRKQARDIGGSTAFSPTDVARTQSTLARSGYNADDILASTESTVNLSLASKVDIAEAADIVTNMQTAFKIPIDEIQRVSDVMTKGFTKSNTDLLELGEAMKYVAPMAQAAGASIEDTTAMLGIMADNGIKGSMAGTGGSAIFSRLQAPTGQAPDALKELGIQTRDKKGNMLPVIGILKKIDASFKKNQLGTAQQAEYIKTIFGEEAAKGVVKLIDAAGNGKLQAKREMLMNSKGSAASVASIQVDNLDGDLKNLSSAWEDVRIEVFDQQNSSLRKLTTTANDWLVTAGKWVKQNPELTQKIVMVTGVLSTLVAGLGLIGLVAWPVMAGLNIIIAGAGLMGTAFSVAGGAITAALGAVTWPIVAVAAAVVAGALLIRKYWEPIKAFIAGVAEGFTAAAGPISDSFSSLKPVFSWVTDKVKELWDWFGKLLEPVKSTQAELATAGDMGKKFGNMLAEGLKIPGQALDQLRSGIDWVLEKLGIIDTKSDGLKDKVQSPDTVATGGAGMAADGLQRNIALGGAAYRPVTAPAASSGYSDQSQNSYQYDIHMHPGMSKDDALALMAQHQERQQRKTQAQQRSRMGWED